MLVSFLFYYLDLFRDQSTPKDDPLTVNVLLVTWTRYVDVGICFMKPADQIRFPIKNHTYGNPKMTDAEISEACFDKYAM